jgi:metallo-beta-lactamase family protein
MQITLFGAAGEVTGSCYLITTTRAMVLVDCGLFQGGDDSDRRNQLPRDLQVDDLDAVVLTHAHLDHSGRLPLLAQQRYRGPIYATPATIDVVGLLLDDAAHLQQGDAQRANRRLQRAGRQPIAPLFDEHDVMAVQRLLRPLPYREQATIAPGVSLQFVEAGHILGSASAILTIEEDGRERVLVFSGDIGPRGAPILNDPAQIAAADLVVLESTYGDRDHRPLDETVAELAALVRQAADQQSKLIIPAFAVGRTQDILYHLAALFREGIAPQIPIYLDSPLAIAATELYIRHPGLADPESRQVRAAGGLWRGLETLHTCTTAAESRMLNDRDGPCIIIAGSGMCTGGRVLHHLRHTLWQTEALVVIVGYQAAGTLGRLLVEGARRVRIYGEEIAVRAQVHTLGGFSAHAGQTELLEWLAPMAARKPQVALTHGEEHARSALARRIAERFAITAELPLLNDSMMVE